MNILRIYDIDISTNYRIYNFNELMISKNFVEKFWISYLLKGY